MIKHLTGGREGRGCARLLLSEAEKNAAQMSPSGDSSKAEITVVEDCSGPKLYPLPLAPATIKLFPELREEQRKSLHIPNKVGTLKLLQLCNVPILSHLKCILPLRIPSDELSVVILFHSSSKHDLKVQNRFILSRGSPVPVPASCSAIPLSCVKDVPLHRLSEKCIAALEKMRF